MRAGTWQPLHSVLLPGDIVPGDGSRDDDATVDMHFHEPDKKLLRALDATEVPHDDCDLSAEPSFEEFLGYWRKRFASRSLEKNPHSYLLGFETSVGCGPLEVLRHLSDEGRAQFTNALLSNNAVYGPWTMRHKGSDLYLPTVRV